MNHGVTIAIAGQPDRNGRIYSEECLAKMAFHIRSIVDNNGTMLGPCAFNRQENLCEVKLADASFQVMSACVEDDRLNIRLHTLETKQGKLLDQILTLDSSKVFFFPVGVGKVDEKTKIVDYLSYKMFGIGIRIE